MTTLDEAVAEFGTDRLAALAGVALRYRDDAPSDLAGVWNAVLCAALDEQARRKAADEALFETLDPAMRFRRPATR